MKKAKIVAIACTAVCVLAVVFACLSEQPEVQGGWFSQSGDTRYYLPDGSVATGYQLIDGTPYYLDDEGAPRSGWQELDGKRCYFRQDGSQVFGWLSLNGERYYLDDDGIAIGPRIIDEKTYLFDDTGLLGSGLTIAEGVTYLADAQGHPQSGWFESRYFDESGRMVTGWVTIGSFLHYFQENGAPATGETEIDGKTLYFASNGQQILFVNPWHTIDPDYTVELTAINENHQIATVAYDDYEEMIAACRSAGLDPAVCSSYRTQEYQQILFERKTAYYRSRGKSQSEAELLAGQTVAYPGTSEHQLGLALDIIDNSNWNLNESQAKTATQKWLMEHSWEYGWILRYPDGKSDITGIIFEPWHYRYVGREIAAEIHESGLCLEEYLESLTNGVG